MNYQEAIAYITELQKQAGSSYSLEAVHSLNELAGRPDRALSIVHIAGTNGKGSVGAYLARILAESGYIAGRYVSPCLLQYRERVQRVYRKDTAVVTEYISETETAEYLSRLRELREQMAQPVESLPTAFEMETVMAFLAMKQWQVDIALIECGMGGRQDATNIIVSPMLCLFTKFGLDHTALLGETLEKIAEEKCGILKPGAGLVSVKQDREAERVLEKRSAALGLSCITADPGEAQDIHYEMGHTVFTYQGDVWELGQSGSCQIENAITAIEAAKVLRQRGYHKINNAGIHRALAVCRWSGRFECISEDPYILVDGAHNPLAAVELRKSMAVYFPGESFSFVCGMFRDKDYSRMLKIMLPLAARIYTVGTSGMRCLPAKELAREARIQMSGRAVDAPAAVQACNSVTEALELAGRNPERILVFGSLSFLQEVYAFSERRKE